jgi:hypothetical protein
MRWPTPDQFRRWTPDDQMVFRKWRRSLVLFYGAIFGLLAVISTFALRDAGPTGPDVAMRSQTTLQSGAARLPAMYQGR